MNPLLPFVVLFWLVALVAALFNLVWLLFIIGPIYLGFFVVMMLSQRARDAFCDWLDRAETK